MYHVNMLPNLNLNFQGRLGDNGSVTQIGQPGRHTQAERGSSYPLDCMSCKLAGKYYLCCKFAQLVTAALTIAQRKGALFTLRMGIQASIFGQQNSFTSQSCTYIGRMLRPFKLRSTLLSLWPDSCRCKVRWCPGACSQTPSPKAGLTRVWCGEVFRWYGMQSIHDKVQKTLHA